MKPQLLLAAAALCIQVFGVFIWDPARIVKIRATDASHAWHDREGNAIMCALMSSDMGAGIQLGDTRGPPSAKSRYYGRVVDGFRWWGLEQIYYWFHGVPRASACDMNQFGWGPAINDLSPNTKDAWHAAWVCHRWLHYDPNIPGPIGNQKYIIGRDFARKMVATGAEYNHATHPDGWMIFQQGLTPRAAAKKYWGRGPQGTVLDSELPDLREHSDFLWTNWWASRHPRHLSVEDDAKKLHFCGVANPTDEITYNLIARYLVARSVFDLEDWPARNSQFFTNTPEGRALLASPAAMQCWLVLLQHKDLLGLKYTTSIRVFRGPPTRRAFNAPIIRWAQLEFEVQDVPPHLVKADPGPNWVRPPAPGPRPPPTVVQPAPNPNQPLGVPGPSNPRPGPPPKARAFRQAMLPEISYRVHYEGNDKNFVRVHTVSPAPQFTRYTVN